MKNLLICQLRKRIKLDDEINGLRLEADKRESEAELRALDDVELAIWLETRQKWIEKDQEKADMSRQKARIKWSVEGDENSKYFHSVIKRKNNKNNFRGIMVEGRWEENPEVIKGEVFKYFKNVFSGGKVKKIEFLE